MNKEIIEKAGELIKMGYSHHDRFLLVTEGYTCDIEEVIKAMEAIEANVIMIRMYNVSNATVKWYSHCPNPPMTLSELRSYLYETSRLMLNDGNGLADDIDESELDYAIKFTIYEVDIDE